MVFTNLSSSEKQAFFGLLDEYFASRPEVVSALNTSGNTNSTQSTANALHSALSSVSAHVEPAWKRQNQAQSSASPSPPPAPSQPELPPSVGRVAAAAAALRMSNGGGLPSPAAVPRPPARKVPSYGQDAPSEQPSEYDSAPSHARISSQADRLVSQKKFGDVDLSSAKNMYSSIRHGTANKSATPPTVAPPVPSAFAPKQNAYGPPPVRRVSSAAPRNEAVSKTASPPPPPPPRPRVEEPEEEGDWAEALYDYSSEDPGDLDIQAGQRILVVERTSEDWWTGEYQGRRGLVPAAYVKLL